MLTTQLGWKAPRNSAQMVYPDGYTKSATDDEINTSFRPSPNYAALAEAATEGSGDWMKGVRVRTVREFREALVEAVTRLDGDRRAMVVEALM